MQLKTTFAAGILAAFIAPVGASAATLDFDTLGNGSASSAGNISGSEFSQFGVLLSSDKQLALFDSGCGPDGSNSCTTQGNDADLATGPSFDSDDEGQVLIVNGGSDAAPNDDASGGLISFSFTQPVRFQSIRLLDLDEAGLFNRVLFRFNFADNTTQEFSGNGDLMGRSKLLNPGFPGNNSIRDIRFGFADVTSLDVEFNKVSGAIPSITYMAPVPLPAGLPLLAAGLGGLALVRRLRTKA